MKNLNKRRNPAPALHRWRDRARHFLGTSLSRVFLLLVAGFLSTATVTAQNGNVAYPENSIDSRMRTSMHVDPTSGALQFQIPLGNYPGRAGAGLPVVLNYSSKLWRLDHVGTTGGCDQWGYCYPQNSDYAAYFAESSAAGWTSNLDWFIWPSGASPIQTYDSQGRPAENMGQWQAARMFVRLPDGSKHELRKDDNIYTGVPSGVYYAVDGSRVWYDTNTQTLSLPDGSRYVGNTQYIDRNGNTLTYNGTSWTDTLGRTIGLPLPAFSTTGEQSQASARDEYYSIPGVGGASLTYTFKWRRLVDVRTDSGQALRPKGDRIVNSCLRVSSLFTSPGICGTDEDHRIISSAVFNPVVLNQIVLPNGSAYTFTYNIYGEIDKVVYPTGGYEKFTHDQAPELSANFTSEQIGNFYAQANRGVYEQRISADGTQASEVLWQYTLGPVNWTTAPNGTPNGTRTERHVHQSQGQLIKYGFDDPRAGLTYDESVWAPNNGPMLRRKLTEWVVDGTVEYDGSRLMYKTRNPRPAREVEIILDTGGNALAAATEMTYDSDLNIIRTKHYDYRSIDQPTAQTGDIALIQNGTLLRTEETTFLVNDPNIDASIRAAYRTRNLLALPTSSRVKEGDNIVAQSSISYDETALQNIGSANGWIDPQTNYRGNATSTGSWLNTTNTYLTTHAQYDQFGNVRSATDAKGNQSQLDYSAAYSYAYPTTATSAIPDSSGQHGSTTAFVSSSAFDWNTGLLTSTTDANNVTTNFEYADSLNRLTRTVRAYGTALQNQTSVGYDDANHVITTTSDQNSYNDNVLKSQLVYDGLGRTFEMRQYEGGTNYIAVRRQYDSMGRAYKTSNPYRPWQSETAVWTTSAFDALGRVISMTTPDSFNNTSDPAVVTTSYSGNTVTVTDQAGKQRKSVTDGLGRLKEVYEDPTGLNYLTSYSYDTLDNLTTVSQGSQSRTFVYDSLKRLSSATTPESGTICYGTVSGGQCQPNGYDANGNLTQKTDARGIVSTYGYDALNRNITIDYSNTILGNPDVPDITRVYDGASNGKGRLWESYSGGTYTVGATVEHTKITGYDALGRPLSQLQEFKTNGVWGSAYTTQRWDNTTQRGYNLAGSITSQTYPSGHTVAYSYDTAGRMSSFSGNLGDGPNHSYATGINYSPFGALSNEQFGTTAAVYHKLHYNIRGQLYDVRASNVNNEWGGELGALVNYYSTPWAVGGSGADNNGNVLGSQTIIGNSYMEDRYSYDSLNRLTSVNEYSGTYTPSALTAQFAQVYTYDRYGNRTIDAAQTSGVGINNRQFTVNTTNNRLGVPSGQSGTMSYDNAGNLTTDTYSGSAVTRVYDAENRMSSETQANSNVAGTYIYNADGQRVRRNVYGVETWQIYGMDGELLAEYAANVAAASPQKEYGYRNGQLLITAEPATNSGSRSNVALASNGATATAQNYTQDGVYPGYHWQPSYAIDGQRYCHLIADGSDGTGVWRDEHGLSSWLEVDFNGSKTIDEVDVFTMADYPALLTQADPSPTQTFSSYGATAFAVQYWTGSAWATVPNGSITGNNLVWKKVNFTAITTTKIRVVVNSSVDGVARVVELEAWGNTASVSSLNAALAANGATGTAQNYTQDGVYPGYHWQPSYAIDGQRYCHLIADGSDGTGVWRDEHGLSSWLQVDFNGSKTINEVDLFTMPDYPALLTQADPSATQTFTSYGTTAFDVQYWTGSAWQTIPGASITNNNLVWKKLNFAAVTTSKIRVVVNAAADGVARIAEVEAWTAASGSGSSSANINWLVTDQLGTPRMIVDQTGALANVKRHDYLPFGEELFSGTGGRTTTQGYTGDSVRQKFTRKERDIETGLDYFGARYYSSVQGRFTGVDIAGPNLINPQSLNKYAYTLNNPLRYIDRNGLYEEDVHYHLTQALAEAAGFTPMQALSIANSNQMTDETPGMSPYSSIEARRNYHFTTEGQRQNLWNDFAESATGVASEETTLGRLGVFMHAQQDSYSHEGYGPVLGHGMAGHAPDKTYNNPEKADRMALDSFNRLTTAATVLFNNQKISFLYKPLDQKVLNPLVQSFNRAKTPEEKMKIVNQIQTLARQNIQRQAEDAIRKKQEEERKRERR